MELRRRLTLVFGNLLVFAVLAEASALAFFYAQTGRLFYTAPQTHALLPETAAGQLAADALHPYFGPLHKPGIRQESNNFGFTSPLDFPFARSAPEQFVIGIFGGSVGEYFCTRGTARLIDRLSRHASFRHKQLVPACFSHEGYKQPQQLIVLAYFLSLDQAFDLVINIDGFNEVALGAFNDARGHDISMPSPLHLDPLLNVIDRSALTVESLEALGTINAAKESLNRVVPLIHANRAAAVGFVLDRYYRWKRIQYETMVASLESAAPGAGVASIIEITPSLKRRDEETLYQDIAAQWMNASAMMQAMLASRSIPYLHVLQPNQYFTQRPFSSEERRTALNERSPFKQPVERGYPALVRVASALSGREHFVDATTIFDTVTAPVYEDDCCHYNDLGNQVLADLIASQVLELVGGSPVTSAASPTGSAPHRAITSR